MKIFEFFNSLLSLPAPGEHKTACLSVSARRRVQARILKYAQEIGWRFVPRDEAVRAHKASLYFSDSLLPKPGALLSNREENL